MSHPLHRFTPLTLGVVVLAMLLLWPTLVIWRSWLSEDIQSTALLEHLLHTVLPGYALTTGWLCLGVTLGCGLVGLISATLVTVFDFPGRRWVEWLLLLPLAMPSFIVAFAYTDFLQFSGSLQTQLRPWLGLDGPLWPDIRSTPGAILVFTFTLYPYVYLLVRAALLERSAYLMASARMLGASLPRRLVTIAWPMARPALAGGLALVLMETLADYGVASYFGIQTLSTGIFNAWLVMDSATLAGQLSTLLLVVVLVLVQLEAHARKRMRFFTATHSSQAHQSRPIPLRRTHAWLALLATTLPVLLGFVAPTLILLHAMTPTTAPLDWGQYLRWSVNSVKLAALTAGLAIVIALLIAATTRLYPSRLLALSAQAVGLGYALPATILVVSLLTALSALDGWLGVGITGWFTTSGLALIWVYLIRFTAVAQQSIDSGYTRLSPHLDQASRTLGVGPLLTFFKIHLPLLRASAMTALLMVFVDVMKELPAALVLRPFNHDTLAVTVYQLARDERLGEAALPALTLVLVGLLPVIWLLQSMRRKT